MNAVAARDIDFLSVAGAFIDPKWDLMYFVEAVDNDGNSRMYRDPETKMPYVVVEVDR